MKFKAIKEGDTVYIRKNVTYSWGDTKSFFLPRKVIRVTKAQFVIENNLKFRKKNGYGFGHSKVAYNLGDKYNYGGNIVTDETKKLELFLEKLKLEEEIRTMIREMYLHNNSKFNLNELLEIKEKLNVFSKTLKSQ